MVLMRFLPAAGFLAALLAAGYARADAERAEKYLEDQGLRRLSSHFALPEEAELTAMMRELSDKHREVLTTQREMAAWQNKVEAKKKLVLGYLQQRSRLRVQLANARTPAAHNRLVLMMNELADRIVFLQESEEEEKKLEAARATANKAAEEYIEMVLAARRLHDRIEAKYAELGGVELVGKAVEHYSEQTGKTYELGPTATLASHDRRLAAMERNVLTDAIPLRKAGGDLWAVSVMFNGRHAQEMAIDTGASIVCLPWKMAQKVGLTPDEDSPTLKLSLADGSVVEGHRVTAESLRVGKFTAEDVECAVLPAEMPQAAPLLGLSFFKNFNFKIDSAEGKLIMSQVDLGGGRP